MQTPDLPDLKPPAIVDTAERTATPGATQPFQQAAVVIDIPYINTLERETQKRNADFILFGDSNHLDIDIWVFYFSPTNINAMHRLGVKVMGNELPLYLQKLIDDYHDGAIEKDIFENILAAELLYTDINNLPLESARQMAKSISNAIDHTKTLGIKIACTNGSEESIFNPEVFQTFKNTLYDIFADRLRTSPVVEMTMEMVLETFIATSDYVRDDVITDEFRISLAQALISNASTLIRNFKSGEPLPPENEAFLQKRRRNDPNLADRLIELKRTYGGRVAELYGFGHFNRQNSPHTSLQNSDVDNALLLRGEKVLTTGVIGEARAREFATRDDRRENAIKTLGILNSLHGVIYLGSAIEMFYIAEPTATATPAPSSTTAKNKPEPRY